MAQIVPIFSMIRKDMSQLLHNKSFMISAVMTIIFSLLLPNIFTFQVRNVHIAIVSHDESELSRNIVQDIIYTSDFILEAQCATYDQALSLVKDGKVDCIIEIPENFERDFVHKSLGMNGAEPQIQISANAVNSTKVIAASQSIVGSILKSLKDYASDRGVVYKGFDSFITTQNFYNPSSDYKRFMLPVIYISIAFVFNLAIRLYTNELQYGTIDQIYVSPMNRFAVTISKLATCYIVSMINILTCLVTLWLTYSFMPNGNFLLMLLGLSLYVICCGSMSLMLCNLLSNASQMVLFSSVVSLIAMMISGFVTPLESVAEWIQPLSYAFPTRYVIIILRNVALKGADFADLKYEFAGLTIVTLIFFTITLLTSKRSRD